jgi:uncharacterized tellurite resistance protein B-like protein
MSIFDWLSGAKVEMEQSAGGDSEAVRDIVSRLEAESEDRAYWIAAFSMVLSRAARADLEISSEELGKMKEIVRDYGVLPEETASLVVEMAAQHNQLLGVTEEYLATREFRRLAQDGDRERLLHCLFAVCAADDSISVVEEEEVRQVANELGLEHGHYTAARSAFREKREVLRGLRSRKPK